PSLRPVNSCVRFPWQRKPGPSLHYELANRSVNTHLWQGYRCLVETRLFARRASLGRAGLSTGGRAAPGSGGSRRDTSRDSFAAVNSAVLSRRQLLFFHGGLYL